jgi:hypothetical protein
MGGMGGYKRFYKGGDIKQVRKYTIIHTLGNYF